VGRQFHLPVPYSGYFKSTDQNLQRIGDYIQSIHPDVVGLLEVDNGSFRASNRCQAGTIARQLNHQHITKNKYGLDSVINKMPLTKSQGNAFLTNQAVRDTRFHYLNNGVKRLVIEMELDDVNMFLVHLSVRYGQRHKQLGDLAALVTSSSKPVIVAGDFNAFLGARELFSFMTATGLINANYNGLSSHPSRAPHRQLDYIFHSPEVQISSFQTPQVIFSDHLPLVCDFSVQDRKLIH
jgi:endonuclease/exonuclease/phosphatase family metal-dependent hydrolase